MARRQRQMCIRDRNRAEPNLFQFLDLVALGTVCDVVPLSMLNRALVKQGLNIMKRRENIGIKVLSDISKINSAPNTQSLGFSLGPRSNAGGRIGNSELGVNLLKENDASKAKYNASKLDELKPEDVKKIIETMIRHHLGWLIVWGGIFGGAFGLIFSLLRS